MPDRRTLLIAASSVPICGARAWGAAGEAALDALLAEHAGVGRESLGMVAAVTNADGAGVAASGLSAAEGGRALDGDTVFEIGSITKVFTALLLADMARRGEVSLDDPVFRFLPPEGRPPERDGRPIRLLDMATYTSGLPSLPANFHPRDPANPYADHTVAQLYRALSTTTPTHAPGEHYEYSNLGFGLLGHALSLRAGRSYEELVVSRICDPLGLGGNHLLVRATGQGANPAHADSETRFSFRGIDAQLLFELGADGTATAVVLRQGGQDQKGARLP